MFEDPVCGMRVEEDSVHRATHEGATYRFCSAGCLAKFGADPARYLGESREAAAPPPIWLSTFSSVQPAPPSTLSVIKKMASKSGMVVLQSLRACVSLWIVSHS